MGDRHYAVERAAITFLDALPLRVLISPNEITFDVGRPGAVYMTIDSELRRIEMTEQSTDMLHDWPGDAELDPDFIPIVRTLRERAQVRPPIGSVTIAQVRVRAAAEFNEWNQDPEPVADVSDFQADTSLRNISVRLYDPRPAAQEGILVYMHGGGWIIGDLDLEDGALRVLANRSGVRILSVDYRLLPEHPFPAAIEDAAAIVRWLADGRGPPVDARRIAIGGASAGANLALGTALKLRDEAAVSPCFLLLLYGAYLGDADTESRRLFGDGRFGLPADAMSYFWRSYAGANPESAHPYAVPARADLRGLPSAFLNHAGLDVLRDDSIFLAARLRDAGIPVEHHAYPGSIHGFTQYHKGSAAGRRALEDAGRALVRVLAGRV